MGRNLKVPYFDLHCLSSFSILLPGSFSSSGWTPGPVAEWGREMGKGQGKGRVNSSPTRELASLKPTLWGLALGPLRLYLSHLLPASPTCGCRYRLCPQRTYFSPRWEAVRKLASFSILEKHVLESALGQEALDTTLK